MEKKQRIPKYKTKITVIPIFADRSKNITDPQYFKILLSNDNKIISQYLKNEDYKIHDSIKELIAYHLNIDPNWPFIKLNSAVKDKDTVELIYVVNILYIENCVKKGNLVNINQIMSMKMDEKYVQSITSTSPGIYGE